MESARREKLIESAHARRFCTLSPTATPFSTLLRGTRLAPRLSAMRKVNVLLVMVALVVGSIVSRPRACAEDAAFNSFSSIDDTNTCGDRYNLLVSQAHDFLVKGDRSGALDSLLSAKDQLRLCEELEERNSMGPVAIALN